MLRQLIIEDNYFSIADRTISLQYRKFRTPRKELRQLILDDKKTYLLSDAEKQKYQKCLNYNDINPDDEIYIDIDGFSIEIAKKLGINYMRNNYILVSPKQAECDSIRSNHISGYIKKVFDVHRNTIEQILMGEALIGIDNKKDISLMIDNPDSLFNIEIILDTPNNALSKLKNIRKEEEKILEDNQKLKDRILLKNLLINIEDISTEHGSLDRIPDKEINLKEKLGFNKLYLDNTEVYCIRSPDGTNVFVYFDNDNDNDNDSDNDSDKETYMNDDIVILNGRDIESLKVLIELGIVGYNPYIGLERAVNMIVRNKKENIPEKAKELLSAVELLVKNNRYKDFFANLGQIKIYMTYPLIQNEILYDLLTKMEDNYYKSIYMDTEKFIQKCSEMDNEQFKDFIENILESLEFIEENNAMANIWLMENRKNVLDELGIKIGRNNI